MGKLQTGVGYCQCGREIWLEYVHNGREWVCRYFDEDNQEIRRCPACGVRLEDEELESCV